MSEYAVTGDDAGKGSLLAAIAEAGFLIGLEKNWYFYLLFLNSLLPCKKRSRGEMIMSLINLILFRHPLSDAVEMASYAPLFVNTNDRTYVCLFCSNFFISI